MKARWLRLGHRPPFSRYLSRSSFNGAPRTPPSLVLQDEAIEEPFFPIKESENSLSSHKPTPSLSLTERRLLGRARLNGIESWEKLVFEADVGHTEDIGSRMIDNSQHRQDLDLWRLILDFNQHRKGVKGTKQVWMAMKFRGKLVQLESHNRNASDLVHSIITAAAQDIPFMKQFALDCVHRGTFPHRLFVWVVSTLLVLNAKAAPTLCALLKESSFGGKDDLLEALAIACQSEEVGIAEAFWQVRKFLPDFKIYDDAMSIIWSAQRPSDAIVLHKHLIARGDFPTTFEALKPFVRHLYTSGGDLEGFLRSLAAVDISFEAQIRRLYSNLSAGSPAETNDSRKPSDETTARALVTFPFDFAINSLKFFGLIEVGPLSVREIVRSSPDSKTLKEKFERLREYEVDTGASTYVRLLKKLSASGTFKTVQDLAKSDMHHDEYEDRDLQRRLLKQYYIKANYQRANSTLTILHQGRLDPQVQSQSINLLLRSAISGVTWRKLLHLIDQVCRERYEVERYTLDLLVQKSLQPQEYTAESIDKVGFLVAILQRLLAAGVPVQPSMWFRPFVALGKHGRLDELEKLSLWLADFYTSAMREPHIFDSDLSKLFTPKLQCALVSWSFTKLGWKTGHCDGQAAGEGTEALDDTGLPWLWGARLLKRLRDENALDLRLPELQAVFVAQVRKLYQPRRLDRIVSNQLHAYAKYRMQPQKYIQSWNAHWD